MAYIRDSNAMSDVCFFENMRVTRKVFNTILGHVTDMFGQDPPDFVLPHGPRMDLAWQFMHY